MDNKKNINRQPITRYDGQYLKCVVTQYKATINVLKNSGTLIVYQPQNENVNYLYLGDEMLASGFGVSTIEKRDILEDVADRYYDDYAYLTTYIDLSFAYTSYEVDGLYAYLNNFIRKDGSVNMTTIDYWDDKYMSYRTAKLRDIIFTGPEAEYNDAKLESQKSIIYTINDVLYSSDNEITYMPIGCGISYVTKNIEISKNDSGGVNMIDVDIAYYNAQHEMNEKHSSQNIAGRLLDNGKYNIKYTNRYDNRNYEYYIANEGLNDIITDISLAISQTEEKKYYPDLAEKDIYVYSESNLIQKHNIDIPGIKVWGLHSIFYDYGTDGITNINLDSASFSDTRRLMIDSDIITFDIPAAQKYLNILVPSNHIITKLEFLDYSTYKTYNWTGSLLCALYKDNNNLMKIGKYMESPYDIYRIVFSKGITDNGRIILHISKISDDYTIIMNEGMINDRTLSIENNWVLTDEDYNSMYWIDCQTHTDEYITRASKNGAD